MKRALTLLVALSSSLISLAQAAPEQSSGSFQCVNVDRGAKALSAPAKAFTLVQLSKQPMKEGTPSRFLLKYADAGRPKSVVVTVTTEDVMVEWKGPKGSAVSGILFLDEDDQTVLKIGSKEGRYKCEWVD